jgi:hypothetical protein
MNITETFEGGEIHFSTPFYQVLEALINRNILDHGKKFLKDSSLFILKISCTFRYS